MAEPHPFPRNAGGPAGATGAGLLLAASVAVAVGSLLLSFRVPFAAMDVVLAANLDRALAAAAAGIAFAVSASIAEATGRRSVQFEPSMFGLATGAAAGFVLGLKLTEGLMAPAALAGVGALLLFAAVRAFHSERRAANLGLLIVLAVALAIAVPTALAAATEGDRGTLALWLLGDVSRASAGGASAALAASLLLCLAATMRIGAANPSPAATESLMIVALGLGIGLAGPIAFVGWFAVLLARHAGAQLGPRARLLLAASAAAALLMAADAVPRMLIGGYAPPLNPAIGVVAIPAFIWWNRVRLRSQTGRSSWIFEVTEPLAIATAAAAFAYVAWQIVLFARSAT